MRVIVLWRVLLGLILSFGVGSAATVVNAQATTNHATNILLVYDSQNIAQHGDQALDLVQRELTGLGLSVTTIRLSDYQSGMINNGHYQGIVTLINWSNARIKQQAFINDRRHFTGPKLHIGALLTPDEERALGKVQSQPHQQFQLQFSQQKQWLTAQKSLPIIEKSPSSGTQFGTLMPQTTRQRNLPFGIIRHNQGFLPIVVPDGVAVMATVGLMAQLFSSDVPSQKPLLAITDITPYTNVAQLHHLIKGLVRTRTPFALSVRSLDHNTELAAFYRFTRELQYAQLHGGVVYFRPPLETGVQRLTQAELTALFRRQLHQLREKHVLPIGVSAAGFWNQTLSRQQAVLSRGNHVLLLPNSDIMVNAKAPWQSSKMTHSRVFASGSVGLPLRTIETVSHPNRLVFREPTALLLRMPTSEVAVKSVLQRLRQLNVSWLDPANSSAAILHVGAAHYRYEAGRYWINGVAVHDLGAKPQRHVVISHRKESTVGLNRVIAWQTKALMWLFTIIGFSLTGLLWYGWRIQRRLFRKQKTRD